MQRVEHGEIGFAGHAEHMAHALDRELVDEDLAAGAEIGLRHLPPPHAGSASTSALCSPSAGAWRGEAAGLPSIMIAERMPGVDPPLALGLGRSIRMPRWITCGSANTSGIVLIGPAGTPMASSFGNNSARENCEVIAFSFSSIALRLMARDGISAKRGSSAISGAPSAVTSLRNWPLLAVA